ncbi:MAG: cytochrome C oxidase subunit IV family protein [Chitinophagales bacterium]
MAAGHLDDAAYQRQKSAVWRSTWIMAVVTVLEVGMAIIWPEDWSRVVLNLLFIIMSSMKAFFIMGEFMHLKYETRALTLTILVPFLFLVWAIIAFMMEGESWLNYKLFWGE